MIEKKRVCGKSIDLDYKTNFRQAREVFDQSPNGPAVCGNADPVSVFYQGTPEEVYKATWKCLEDGGDRCLIAAGCEIPDGTLIENIKAQNNALSDFAGRSK